MARGPLPNEKKRRRNKDTIPTTELDVAGRKGRPPKPPEAYNFLEPAAEWWKWAWGTPQALAWDSGAFYVVVRRAQLEDDLASIDEADHLSDVIDDMIAEAIEEDDPLNFKNRLLRITLTMRKLKSLAGGRVGVMKEMRELDKVLGLSPAAMASLRWKIVDKSKGDAAATSPSAPTKKQQKKASDRKARLSLVKSA